MPLNFIKILLRLLQWRPNICHAVIPMAALTIVMRMGILGDHIKALDRSQIGDNFTISAAHAATEPPKAEDSKEEPGSKTKIKPEIEEAIEQVKAQKPEEKFDPLTFDENQMRVLKALATKEEGESDEELQRRQKLLELSEKKLAEQLSNLEKMKNDVQTKKELLSKEEKENVASTAKIYEAMKPEQAADIFNKMDTFVLAQLLKSMNQKKASQIIAIMDQNKARAVTIEMLRVLSSKSEPTKQ